ncbi:CHAT domain-containing protein [Porphyrobacter sp. AAP60]|uniref:CHAT domain-containing protein n=1 Tax=Porphyrobacter sp. AAP60 TaxID=1523423 RepID=UPI0006B973BB|nr:CHAT domain-containing tetratricopeptide repeat protein [Porphyrobacter sp. AAP60]
MKNLILICAALVQSFLGATELRASEPEGPAAASSLNDAEVSKRVAALNDQASELLGKGDAASALPLQSEALRLAREVLGELHADTLTSLNAYADVLQSLGQTAEAEPLYAEALRLSRELLGDRHLDTLTSLNSYADILHDLDRAAEAEPPYVEALRLRREVLGDKHPDTLTSLSAYAHLLTSHLDRAAEAEPLYSEALRLHREVVGERHPDTLNSLNNYALVLESLGRVAEAEPLLAEALRLSREVLGDRHPDTLNRLSGYAALLNSLGRAAEAEPLFAEELRLSREVLGNRHPNTLTSLNNYAEVLLSLGRAAEAEPIQAEGLRLRREVLGERHIDTLTSLHNFATVLLSLRRAAEAEPLFAEALRFYREELGERHPNTLVGLTNYANVLENLGRADEAVPLYAEALRLFREVMGERHPSTLASLSSYATALSSLGQAAEAEPLYAEALPLLRGVLGERHPNTLNTLSNYAHVLLDSSQAKAALPLSRELVETTRGRAVELVGEGLRGNEQVNRELGRRQYVERLHVDVLWSNSDPETVNSGDLAAEAFVTLQLASADSTTRAVATAAASRFAADLGLQELGQERQTLIREWPEIEAELVEAQAGGEAAAVDREKLGKRLQAVEQRVGEIDARLAVEAPQYFAILNQQSVELEQLRTILGPDEAVLLLVPTLHGTHTMVVTREAIRWQKADPNLSGIQDAVETLREGLEIEGGGTLPEFDLELAYGFYAHLIEPVEEGLKGKQRVYVVADGPLSRLPLGVFVTSPPVEGEDFNDPEVLRGADWLADRYALVQLPSIQSLVYIRSFGAEGKLRTEGGFHGFGAPVLKGQALLRGARSATLSPVDASRLIAAAQEGSGRPLMDTEALRHLASLPGTRTELVQVQRALGASEDALYLEERMTETAIRTIDLSQTSVLHLATHAFTSEEADDLAEPGLVFTPPALAQASDDGYLAASEVVGIDLTSVAWVILSACNTASPSGREGETGLSGLAQAFFYAGAETLLVSHWPVFDEIAPLITVETVKASIAGMPRAEALQAAMRKVRDEPALEAEHPAVWAPFTLLGEGR